MPREWWISSGGYWTGSTLYSHEIVRNEEFKLPQIADLIARKLAGPEQSTLPDGELDFHHGEYHRLRTVLEESMKASQLPESPAAKSQLNDLLIQVRLEMA
jgi:hypothetical protein